MKKLLTSSLVIILALSFFGFNVNSTKAQSFTPNMEGTWYCQSGLPVTAISWGDYSQQGYTVSKYFVRKNGIIVATLFPPTSDYVDTSVTYNTNYRYILEAEATPTNFAAVDGGDITTGSCMYVSSVSGPSSVNAGDSVSVSGTFVWGSNSAATYTLGIYTSGGSAIDTYGGAGLSSSPQTVTSPSGQITAPSTAGTYQICAKGDIPGAGLSDSKCKSITVNVDNPPASMTHTENTSSVDVGGSVTTSGSGTNVTGCSKTATIPPGKPSVSYFETYPAIDGNVTVPQTTVTGFSQPTDDIPYYLNLTCSGIYDFASLDKASNLAKFLEPFLGFVKVAYAATSKTISLPVYVNALPNAVLNVNSSGASGVFIDGLSGLPDFTTNDTYTKTSTISGTLLALSEFGGKTFTGWGGNCNSINNYTCSVLVNTGEVHTVTAYYSTPVPSQPNLNISSISVSPSSPTEGDSVTVNAVVRNSGDASAGANSTTRLKIDLYDNGGGSLWDQTSDKITGNLASGATETETWNNVWTAVEGFHRIRVCADHGGVIAESNESDNCANTYVTVTGVEPPPPPANTATLNVQSSGASGVSITRVSGPSDINGVTNYARSYDSNFSTVIQAPSTKGNATYTGWTGCASVVSQNCSVGVNLGESKTVVANYSTTPPPPPSFNYSLSNSGLTSAEKGSVDVYTQNTITKTLTAGTGQSVSLTASGLPSGVSYSVAPQECSPTCTSVITFTVSPSAPVGDYNITVTGSPLSKTTTFTLRITGSPIAVSCVPDPATAMIGQPVTWTANVSGGSSPYTYVWSGTGVPTSPVPTANPYTLTYSTIGAKTITAQVTDSASSTSSCPANSTVQINFNPTFEEF